MAGCGGRRPNMEEEADGRSVEMPPVPAAHQGPESSDDPSAAPPNESPEHIKTLFTEEQLDILETLFKCKLYLTRNELEQVANQLSVSQNSIQVVSKPKSEGEESKKRAQRGLESSDDRSSAEYSPEKSQLRKRTVFTEEQLNTLYAFFKKEPYPIPAEWDQLTEQLSLPKRTIQIWFQRQRDKMKHPSPSPKKLRIQDQAGNSQTPTRGHRDSQHKQKMVASIKDVQAQKQSHSDSFSPPQPVESSALPQGPHSSDKVYYQNVGGPPDSCCGTEVYQMPPESGHKPPSASHYNKRRTRIWIPVSSMTIDLTSDDPSTSSAPSTSQMTTVLDNADDGPSTSSAPSTSQMTTVLDNADDGSSTDTASLINVEATDSD